MRLEAAIDSVFRDCQSTEVSSVMLGRLAQHVTVLASGYLESTCREVVVAYTAKRADQNVVNYVSNTVRHFSNPKMGKILDLVGNVDTNAMDELQEFTAGKIRASVNSIVSNRHRIAHGRSSQITMSQIRSYYEDAQRLARKIKELLL